MKIFTLSNRINATILRMTVSDKMSTNDAQTPSFSPFSSFSPKRIEKNAPLPMHKPNRIEVRNVISVNEDPTAARASEPRYLPTISVSAML